MTYRNKTTLKAEIAATTAGGRQGEVVIDDIIDSYVDQSTILVPQGRLTLSSGVPFMTGDVAGATTVFYTPCAGRFISIFDGAQFQATDLLGQLSQATTDATKSPAAVTANNNYDLFVWNDAGTIRCTRGPAWTGASSRGAGAGTSELELFAGVLVNKNAITNGPALRQGTYVGTVHSNGSSQIDWKLGGAANGGSPASLGVFNYYHRRTITAMVTDNGAPYALAPGAVRQARASAGNQIQFLVGMQEDGVSWSYATFITTGAVQNSGGSFGVGFDQSAAFSVSQTFVQTNTNAAINGAATNSGVWLGLPSLGFHTLFALEQTVVAACNMNGGSAGALMASIRM